jgi:hypothetical protein
MIMNRRRTDKENTMSDEGMVNASDENSEKGYPEKAFLNR